MLKNYIKIAWRNLIKNKLFSFINIFGLCIGITCCVLIFIYVQNELSYDRYNSKAEQIYRMNSIFYDQKKEDHAAATSLLASRRISENFPEIKKAVRFTPSGRPIEYNHRKFADVKILYADSTVFDVFTFPLIKGDARKALAEPYSIVLTETEAKKYFGSEEPMGKLMKLSDTISLAVTGVIKDVPKNSHFTFDCLISRGTLNDLNKNNAGWAELSKDWFNCDSYAYILLADNVNAESFEIKANRFLEKEMTNTIKATGLRMNIDMECITDIHLRSTAGHEMKGSETGDITYVYIFSATAFLILLIACCNFINLSTARSLNRSKEIGLRKVIGAQRRQIIFQFLGESVLCTFIASAFSLLFVFVAIPLFNSFIGTSLAFNPLVFWIYLLIIFSVGLLAGLYPAVLMSSFQPIRSLKGKVSHGVGDIIFRKGLVVFQFSIAIVLIISTVLILQQLNFIQTRKIGLNKEQVLGIELKGADQRKGEIILKELAKNPQVTGASLNGFNFKGIPKITMLPEGRRENEITATDVFAADENFISTMQIELAAGRNFSSSFPTDANEAFIVNEAAVKFFNWKSPKDAIGKKIDWAFGKSGKVIGVVKDFNYTSFHNKIEPLLIHMFPAWYSTLTVRLKTTELPETLKNLDLTWKESGAINPFKYAFLEDDFNSLYKSEQNMRSVLSVFTFLSVFVACLGLLGLSAFTIRQRFKEIGIRKVLGANIRDIVTLLSKDFLKLVLLSILIASPLAFYMVYKWLLDFEYKVHISGWVFIIAGGAALLIAMCTVSLQAISAALTNPVKSIRTEN